MRSEEPAVIEAARPVIGLIKWVLTMDNYA